MKILYNLWCTWKVTLRGWKLHSMSSSWTKREASMEFPYTKELGVTTLQTIVFRRETQNDGLTLKEIIKWSFIKISGFSDVISWTAKLSLGVEICFRCVQLYSEASLHIKDSTHSSLIRCQSSGGFGLFNISLPSLWSRAMIKRWEIRLFKLICSILTKAPPLILRASRWASSSIVHWNILVLTQ